MEGLQCARTKRLAHLGLTLWFAGLGLACLMGLVGCIDRGGHWVYASVSYQGETHDVNVYLPEGYPEAASYPVVYLLHGWPEHPERWRRADVESHADLYGLVLVAVEGDDDDITPAWYSRRIDLPYPAGSDWRVSFYDWFFEGVLPWVEANYSVRADPGGRAIVGFSMGGKGALSLAGHRPDLFAAVVEIAGVMDLRDYADRYEIRDVYGPLAEHELCYAADSPIELAPNLKGLSITLLHGADDTYWVHYEQGRMMSERLDALGYPYVWEEIPGQEHDPVSAYEITRTFESLAAAFDTPYSSPPAWRYRFADDVVRRIYDTTIAKTSVLTWTEIMSVTATGFETASGDAFSMTTAPIYTPFSDYTVTVDDLWADTRTGSLLTAGPDGRLLVDLSAGRLHVEIAPVQVAGNWTYNSVTYLSETLEVSVYLPIGYPADAPYPVVYLLHGHGMTSDMWERSDVQDQAEQNGLVLVAVEGDDSDIIASWYSRQAKLPWPGGPDWKVSFYDWFFQGVLPWVESTYDVRAEPGGRAIAGFSMGGKGALSLAGHHPDLFAAAAGIAGVMDLRDYSTVFEIPDVYGPLVGNEIVYAADSPFDLAPNLKGVSLTLLHGAEDRLVDKEQSRKMSQALDDLGYSHQWEEIPGQYHEPVSTYEITRTFEFLADAFDVPYSPPEAWRYRFADDVVRHIYDATITKTSVLTWTEITSVTATGLETVSGDVFSLTTASTYTPLRSYNATVTNLSEGGSTIREVIADEDGRLSLTLPAGRHRIAISAGNLFEHTFLPVIFKAAPESGSLRGLCYLPDHCCQAKFLHCLPLW